MLPLDMIGLGLFILGSIPVVLFPRWKARVANTRKMTFLYASVVFSGLIGYGGWVLYWVGLLQLAVRYFALEADLLLTIILASLISIATYNFLLDHFGRWLDHLLGKPGAI